MRIPSFAIKNLKRKIARTVVLMLAVSVVTGTLFSASIFMASMQTALKIGTYRLGADVLIVPEQYEAQARSALLSGEPTSFYMSRDILEKAKKVEGVKVATPQVFIKPTSFTCCFNVDVFLIAFDPATDFTVMPWAETHLKKRLGSEEIITGREVPVVVGDTLPFFGTFFKVAGTMEPTGMNFFDKSVFMTIDDAYRMAEESRTKAMQPIDVPKSVISTVLVQVGEDYTPDRVAIRLEHNIPGIRAIASDEIIGTVRRQLGRLFNGIYIIGGVLWLLALLLMGFAFYMIVNERQREIGVLRAMGALKRHVFGLIITEALTISMIGGIMGLACGTIILTLKKNLIIQGLKLPYLLPPAPVLLELMVAAIAFALLTGFLAVILPALSASNMEPYEAIRRGE